MTGVSPFDPKTLLKLESYRLAGGQGLDAAKALYEWLISEFREQTPQAEFEEMFKKPAAN